MELRPQPGPQETFLATSADIAIYGGGAGGGKTAALLLEVTRHIHNKKFTPVIFRRTSPQIRNNGGLWDESLSFYEGLSRPLDSVLIHKFHSGCELKFQHLEHEKNLQDHQGAAYAFIGFDEMTHFTKKMFFYLLSRNRSMCGVKPYIRGTCNPDPDSWVAEFISWWIDQDTGLPIPERAGVIRFFIVKNNIVHWADTAQELIDKFQPQTPTPEQKITPKSFTFVPALLTDNKILMEANPEYLANLNALHSVDRERLLNGNWKIRDSSGSYFKRGNFQVIDHPPPLHSFVRYWDRAATEDTGSNDPSWTAGVKMARCSEGYYYILDVIRFRAGPGEVQRTIRNTATQDGHNTTVGIEQDPGQAGKFEALTYVRDLAGFTVQLNNVKESKGVRAKPLATQVEHGMVRLVRGAWNEAFITESENFDGTDKGHADQVDAASGAFHLLTNSNTKPQVRRL